MTENVWLDVSLIRCPYCGKLYVDASWYILDMESDIECTNCGHVFNSKKNLIDRVLLKFIVQDKMITDISIVKHHLERNHE